MNDKRTTKFLSRFGLSQQEIDLYTATLALGTPTAGEISRNTGLQRTLVYFHLNELIKKHFVVELKKGKIKRFQAVAPKEVAERFQRWTTDVFSIVPELESLQTIDEETPRISVHDFATMHYEHYNELASMPEGSEFRVIQSKKSADLDFKSFKEGEFKQIMQRMVERNIMTRAIFTDDFIDSAHEQIGNDVYAIFKQRNWQLRAVNPDRFDFEEMMIHQDKVTFLLTDVGIIVRIQHKRIARAMTAMFDALWLTGHPRTFK